mgnify:CR=1 FL=1
MLNIDRKEGTFEFDGSAVDIISDISYAIFYVTNYIVSNGMSRVNWNDTLDYLMDTIKGAVEDAHKEEQNGTFG